MAEPHQCDVSQPAVRIRRIETAARRSLALAALSGFAAFSLLIFTFTPGTEARFYDSQPLGMQAISTGQLTVAPVDGQEQAILRSRQSTPKSSTRVFTDGTRSVDCDVPAPDPQFAQQCVFHADTMDLLTVSGGDDVVISRVVAMTVHGKNLRAIPKAEMGTAASGLPEGTTVGEPVIEHLDSPDLDTANATAVLPDQSFAEQPDPHYFKVSYTVSLKNARCDQVTCAEITTATLPEITFTAEEADR